MRRRELIRLAAAAAAYPLIARAQQPVMPVIGFLHATSPADAGPQMEGFRKGLTESGYVEGRNFAIEYHWAEGHYDRLPTLAASLVQRRVAVIFAGGGNAPAQAAVAATGSIPIVFVTGSDPVQAALSPVSTVLTAMSPA
jgi:putative ABC transport system substrate-binding protein